MASRNRGRKRRGAANVVHDLRRKFRWSIEKVFTEAASWLKRQFGRTVKVGIVREHIRKYVRKGEIPDYVRDYASHALAPQPA